MAILTTARKPDNSTRLRANRLSLETGIPFIERGNLSLELLISEYEQVLLVEKQKFACHTTAGELFFHPNLSALRIKNLRQGAEDFLCTAMQLQPGDQVLDCTAGLCADSIVASFVVGDHGQVTALEASLYIYLVVREGIRAKMAPSRLQAAVERINLVHADYRTFLNQLPAKSYDIVYFDPMFAIPVQKSSAFTPLRPLAEYNTLTKAVLEQAARVARRVVVVKERSFFDFEKLGLDRVIGGKGSKIAYGIYAPGGSL